MGVYIGPTSNSLGFTGQLAAGPPVGTPAPTNPILGYTLSAYMAKTLDYLKDPNNQFWTTAQIQDYVARARNYVAIEGGTTLVYLNYYTYGFTVPAQQEINPFPTVNGKQVMVLEDVIILWGNLNFPLNYAPWSTYLSRWRVVDPNVYLGIPYVFTQIQPQGQFYIYPPAFSEMAIEFRARFYPSIMTSTGNDVDVVAPFQDLVPIFAAVLGLYNQKEWQGVKELASLYQSTYTVLTGRQSRLITQYLRDS